MVTVAALKDEMSRGRRPQMIDVRTASVRERLDRILSASAGHP
jgi:hypothetical protein